METLSPSVLEQISAVIDQKLPQLSAGLLYNTVEAAAYLKCSTVQVWRLRRAGRLPFVPTGGKPLYTRQALESILKEKGAAV